MPEEADVYLKCRKLGFVFQPSNKEESIGGGGGGWGGGWGGDLIMRRNNGNCNYKENKLNADLTSLPNPPPLSKNENFNKNYEQMSYIFKCCAVSNDYECRLNMHVSKENICRCCSHHKNLDGKIIAF